MSKITKKSKIAVIAGGISTERDVSLRSGANVLEALHRLGYKNAFLFEFDTKGSKKPGSKSVVDSLKNLQTLKDKKEIDLAFLTTHGQYGEDGCLQGLLELLAIPYTGSRVNASSASMDKLLTKKVLLGCGLPTLPCWFEEIPKVFGELDGIEAPISLDMEVDEESMIELLPGPFIIKPRDEGSSVGIVKIDNFDAYNSDAEFAEKFANCFVEPFIDGIEVTTSVVDISHMPPEFAMQVLEANDAETPYAVLLEDGLLSLPILELRPKNDFYDYESKYTQGMTEFVLPADLHEDMAKVIHEYAIDAFKSLECSGFARVDFMIAGPDSDYAGPQILEINTLPGMTDTSDMPAQAEAAGISYDELVELIALRN